MTNNFDDSFLYASQKRVIELEAQVAALEAKNEELNVGWLDQAGRHGGDVHGLELQVTELEARLHDIYMQATRKKRGTDKKRYLKTDLDIIATKASQFPTEAANPVRIKR